MVEVSVIVPVFRVEKTLNRCVDSILNQKFNGYFEIILVNDGSDDNSLEICKDYCTKYDNIKIIDKKNGGLSSARNAGMEIAQGKYIMFIDSDDEIRQGMIEKMYNRAEQDNSDMVGCGHVEIYPKNKTCEKAANFPDGVYDHDFLVKNFATEIFGNINLMWPKKVVGYSCCNLYRKSVIVNNKLVFQNENTYFNEDEVFLLEFICKSSKMSIVNEPFYCYYINGNSLSHRYRKGIWDMKLALIDKFAQSAKELNIVSEYNEHIVSTIHDAIRISIHNEFEAKCEHSLKEIKAEVSRICENVLTEQTLQKKHSLELKLIDKFCFFMVKHKWAWGITLFYKTYFSTFNFLRKVKKFCVKS